MKRLPAIAMQFMRWRENWRREGMKDDKMV